MFTCYDLSLWHLSPRGITIIITMPIRDGRCINRIHTEMRKVARRGTGGLFYLRAT
jgi:hypothetical protein